MIVRARRRPTSPGTRRRCPEPDRASVGATVWLTGLSGSGKSTVAVEVERALVASGRPAYLLDGDNIRHGLNGDLGFTAADRAENVRRVGHVARLFADAGLVAVVPLISPYRADRDAVRSLHADAGLPFLEVHVDTPIELCEQRDPKGLYAKARAGQLKGFTGIDDPYEAPSSPELVLVPADGSPCGHGRRRCSACCPRPPDRAAEHPTPGRRRSRRRSWRMRGRMGWVSSGRSVGGGGVVVARPVVVLDPDPAALVVDVADDLLGLDPGPELHLLVAVGADA